MQDLEKVTALIVKLTVQLRQIEEKEDFDAFSIKRSASKFGAVLGDAWRTQLRANCSSSMLGEQIFARRAEPRAPKTCSSSMLGVNFIASKKKRLSIQLDEARKLDDDLNNDWSIYFIKLHELSGHNAAVESNQFLKMIQYSIVENYGRMRSIGRSKRSQDADNYSRPFKWAE
uniref:Uncharacterized protein n=1 Tax=Romanomermis culicivorax TaxID=13658 RepID=A0A915KWA5_ROMCU